MMWPKVLYFLVLLIPFEFHRIPFVSADSLVPTSQYPPIKPVAPKNMLFFTGFTFYSHRMSVWPLVQELAAQGHNITFVSCHPPKPAQKDPRIHDYVPQSLAASLEKFSGVNLLDLRLQGYPFWATVWEQFFDVSIATLDSLAGDAEFLRWMDSTHFDLVFMDAACDFGIGFAHKWAAQVVIFSTTSPYAWQSETFGTVVESWIPDPQYALQEDMGFLDRIFNVLRPLEWEFRRRFFYFPRAEKIYREKLGLSDIPDLVEMERNVSLVLVNMHFSEDYPRSLPPKVIPIGGIHCGRPEGDAVSEDLVKFMNQSKDGFVYVNFGSNAEMSKLPLELRTIFFNVMRETNINFVVKWNDVVPDDMPKNAFLAKWMPQQKILGHQHIKAFITHGGILGSHEAVCAGVPLIFLPMFGEQDFNANRHAARGTSIKLTWETLTQENLQQAVTNILQNPTYKQNMEKMSKLFLDRPEPPLKTAVWWIDFILRHGRVEEMQSRGVAQTWYQRRQLDVWVTLGVGFCSSIFILCKILRLIFIKLGFPKQALRDASDDRKKR